MSFLECSTVTSEPCTNIELLCGCNIERLDNYEELLIRSDFRDTGIFTLRIQQEDIPENLLDCCCVIRVTVDWPEVEVEGFVAFTGRITKQTLFDADEDVYSFEGEGILGKLGDTAVSYTSTSQGSVKCCSIGDVTGDLSVTVDPTGSDIVLYDQSCGNVATLYADRDPYTETLTTDLTVDVSACGTGLADIIVTNPVNVTTTVTGNVISVVPTVAGAFSFDYELLCGCVSNTVVTVAETAVALVSPVARDLEVQSTLETVTVDVSTNDNECVGLTSVIIQNRVNATVTNTGNGVLEITPTAVGGFLIEYELYCDCIPSGSTATITGEAHLEMPITYQILNVDGATVTPELTDGPINIDPLQDDFSFDYEVICGGIPTGDIKTITGSTGGCVTALQSATEYAIENLVTPLDDRLTPVPDCYTVTVTGDDTTDPYCGNGSGKNLLTLLSSMAKNHNFDFSLTVSQGTGDCCLTYDLTLGSVGDDLRPFTVAECLGTAEIQAITDDCIQVNTVVMLGNDLNATVTADEQSTCGSEIVIDASSLDDESLTDSQRLAILTSSAEETIAENNRGKRIAFVTIWSCGFLPFKGNDSGVTYLWLGDRLLFTDNDGVSGDYRVEQMYFNIRNDKIFSVIPVLEEERVIN